MLPMPNHFLSMVSGIPLCSSWFSSYRLDTHSSLRHLTLKLWNSPGVTSWIISYSFKGLNSMYKPMSFTFTSTACVIYSYIQLTSSCVYLIDIWNLISLKLNYLSVSWNCFPTPTPNFSPPQHIAAPTYPCLGQNHGLTLIPLGFPLSPINTSAYLIGFPFKLNSESEHISLLLILTS